MSISNVKCLVTGASRTHETDVSDPPVSWVEIGGQPVILHVVHQLYLAGIRNVVLQLGLKGDVLKQCIDKEREELLPGMNIEVQDLGPRFRGGHAVAIQKAAEFFKGEETFLLVPGDHIYSEKLIASMLEAGLDETLTGRMLVEADLQGMVGLPQCTVYVGKRPLHSVDRVYQLGRHLASYSSIDAGLLLVRPDLFDLIEKTSKNVPYVILSDAMQEFALLGNLTTTTTDGHDWFSVETEDSAAYTKEKLKSVGHKVTGSDGSTMYLVGLPKKGAQLQASGNDGGDWAQFECAKWQSAVFCVKGFFQVLYDDTTVFVRDYIRQLGGSEKVLLVEVGCGTGEALIPLHHDAKYTIGMDINPLFIDFCNESLPKDAAHKAYYMTGDAQKLVDLVAEARPAWMDTNKVVICVGNTMGILPEAIKPGVYQQMAELAGPHGICVVVFWNGNSFGEALQHFYGKNPQLCGPFTGECIDLPNCVLETPSGYRTHWTTPEEAKQVVENQGMKLLACEEKGRGVLIAFRKKDE